jgi:aryl-alcohol dehydrogenase (NADP+)
VAAIGEIAGEASVAMPPLAVAWIFVQAVVTSPIVGASHPDQLTSTLAATEIALPQELLDG